MTQAERLEAVWRDLVVGPEVLKSQIADIRRILGDDPWHPPFIETRHRHSTAAPIVNIR